MTWKKRLLLCAAQATNFLFSRIQLRPGTTDLEVYMDTYLLGQLKLPVLHRPVSLIIDGGAYTGITSVWFAQRYRFTPIIAVEPDQENYRLLKRNCDSYRHIHPLMAGLWYKKGRLCVADRGTGEWGHIVAEEDKGEVPAVTIDSLLHGHARVGILKLDIEGAERFLFRKGCESWLRRTDCIIIELHDKIHPDCSENFWKFINREEWHIQRRCEKYILTRRV